MVNKRKSKRKSISSSRAKSKCIPETQVKLIEGLKGLWIDHALWTRNAIVGIIDELEGTQQTIERLLRNQDEIGDFYKPYYGSVFGNKLASLLREHIVIAGELVTAAKNGEQEEVERLNKLWYKNGDAIVDLISDANPHIDKARLSEMFDTHLQQVFNIAAARLNKDWEGEIIAFDVGKNHLIHMADYLAKGIIKQFPDRFK